MDEKTQSAEGTTSSHRLSVGKTDTISFETASDLFSTSPISRSSEMDPMRQFETADCCTAEDVLNSSVVLNSDQQKCAIPKELTAPLDTHLTKLENMVDNKAAGKEAASFLPPDVFRRDETEINLKGKSGAKNITKDELGSTGISENSVKNAETAFSDTGSKQDFRNTHLFSENPGVTHFNLKGFGPADAAPPLTSPMSTDSKKSQDTHTSSTGKVASDTVDYIYDVKSLTFGLSLPLKKQMTSTQVSSETENAQARSTHFAQESVKTKDALTQHSDKSASKVIDDEPKKSLSPSRVAHNLREKNKGVVGKESNTKQLFSQDESQFSAPESVEIKTKNRLISSVDESNGLFVENDIEKDQAAEAMDNVFSNKLDKPSASEKEFVGKDIQNNTTVKRKHEKDMQNDLTEARTVGMHRPHTKQQKANFSQSQQTQLQQSDEVSEEQINFSKTCFSLNDDFNVGTLTQLLTVNTRSKTVTTASKIQSESSRQLQIKPEPQTRQPHLAHTGEDEETLNSEEVSSRFMNKADRTRREQVKSSSTDESAAKLALNNHSSKAQSQLLKDADSAVAEIGTVESHDVAEDTPEEIFIVAENVTEETWSAAEDIVMEPCGTAEMTSLEPYSVATETPKQLTYISGELSTEPFDSAEEITAGPHCVAEMNLVQTSHFVKITSVDVYCAAEELSVEQHNAVEFETTETWEFAQQTSINPFSFTQEVSPQLSFAAEESPVEVYGPAEEIGTEPYCLAEVTTVEPYAVAERAASIELCEVFPSTPEETLLVVEPQETQVGPFRVAEMTLVEFCSTVVETPEQPCCVAERVSMQPLHFAEETQAEPRSVVEEIPASAELNHEVIAAEQISQQPRSLAAEAAVPDSSLTERLSLPSQLPGQLQTDRGASARGPASATARPQSGSCVRCLRQSGNRTTRQSRSGFDPCPDCLNISARHISFPESVNRCDHQDSSAQCQGEDAVFDISDTERTDAGQIQRKARLNTSLPRPLLRTYQDVFANRPLPCLSCMRIHQRDDGYRCSSDLQCNHPNSSEACQEEREDDFALHQYTGQGRQPEDGLCRMCLRRPISVVLFDCLHSVLCCVCSCNVRVCPVCSQLVVGCRDIKFPE